MSPQEMKDVFNRFVDEVLNKGDLQAFDKYTTPDYVETQVPPGLPLNREGSKIFFGMMHTALPDLHVTADDAVAEGNKLVVRTTWTGTNTGEFMGFPPSGRQVKFIALDEVVLTEDGKASIHWGVTDLLTFLMQIGAVPAPGQ